MRKTLSTILSLLLLASAVAPRAAAQDTPGTVKFPSALDTQDSLIRASNSAKTTLSTSLTIDATTITVVSTTSFPASGAAMVDSEIFFYTAKTGTTFTGVTRGADSTAAATHSSGAAVRGVVTAAHHNTHGQAIVNVQTKVGSGSSTPSTGTILKGTGPGTSGWSALSSSDLPQSPTFSGTVTAGGFGNVNATTGNFSGTVTAGAFVGSGAGITGLTGATGGVANTGSTTVGADTDADGVGVIDLQTGGVTRMRLNNDGTLSGTAIDTLLAAARAAIGVSVSSLATAGDGSTGNPYTGWDAVIGTGASNTTYYFEPGKVYYYTTPLVILNTHGARLVGGNARSSVLRFGGAGVAVTFKSTGTGFLNGIENVQIEGNASATGGLYTESSHSMRVINVNVRNVSQKAFHVKFGVLNYYQNCRVSMNDGVFTTTPVNGFYTEGRSGPETFQANVIDNLIIEHVFGDGIVLNDAWQNHFNGGSSEVNGGRGVLINATSRGNKFTEMDCEVNGGDDWTIYGDFNKLDGVLSTGLITLKAGALKNVIDGGQLNSVTVDSGASSNILDNINFNLSGAGGAITINDDSTTTDGQPTNIATGGTGGGNSYPLQNSPLNLGLSYSLNPGAWKTDFAVVNLGALGAIFSRKTTTTPGFNECLNCYLDPAGVFRYKATGIKATKIVHFDGEVIFSTAPAGTADAAITFTDSGKFSSNGALYVNDGGTLKAVTYGAADSGGTGFKVLRIAN